MGLMREAEMIEQQLKAKQAGEYNYARKSKHITKFNFIFKV